MSRAREVVAQAAAARQAGRTAEARTMLEALLRDEPGSPHAWNLLGVIQIEAGEIEGARTSFAALARLDPKPPVVWLNLGRAHEAAGDHAAALRAFDEALAREAYFLPALLAKSRALAALGREAEALALTRAFLAGIPGDDAFPPAIRAQLADARAFVAAQAERSADRYLAAIAEVEAAYPGADLVRARGYAEHRAGRRKIYQQQPTGGHFPFLPAFEYFDRALFPWFEALEGRTAAIRTELLSLWAEEDPSFRPYVAYDAAAPVNQWAELNHSPRWSAWFLWEDGVRNDAHCARCPATAAALEKVPLLDIAGKAPSVMFSVLQPRTRIPAHTGTSNARTTVHLPLVVPEGCGFRVGAETRQWREGEAWAFDDTIEHEAWNDSDAPRALLILDVWNPLLSEAERAAVRLVG
ncbi:MAG TPA: aspartyl/asparaginyl beta-hydroxylase domain-containing protein [Allosphingosinicella sp.]|nr:aspartyl/asparaginyl beta-hydroxylase domain-containing protein [Allosphingosinicella sp.]